MDTTPAFDYGDRHRHLSLADVIAAAAAAGHDLVEVERGHEQGRRADEHSAFRVAADRQREGYPLDAREQALLDSYRNW
jgi:hypothetical protein